jgi:small ligand-binding sensory domain FIST
MLLHIRGQELYGKANVDSAGFNASFAYYYIYVRILVYVSAYYCMCVLILVHVWRESRGQELYGKANVDSAGFSVSFPSSRALCGFFCNGEIGSEKV